MEVAAKDIDFENKRITLVPIGDLHLGSRACDEKRITRLTEWILARPDTYVIGMGDYAELIPRQDARRFDADSIKPALLKNLDNLIPIQRDMIIDTFSGLAAEGRLLGLLAGNHEMSIKKNYSMDIMEEVCTKLDTPNLGFSCLYRLTLKHPRRSRNVVVYAHHGWGGGRKPGSSINKLIDLMSSYEADIYLSGHDHEKIGKRQPRLSITSSGKPRLRSTPAILGRTGTFLRTAQQGTTNYAEVAGYPPTDLGVLRIDIRMVGKHEELDLHVSE